jgi:type IV fimbrial biogenesis protein FimT
MLEVTAMRIARGFTLIEMLVTLTVLAILMGVGVPSFRSFVAGQKVKTVSYDLMTALMQARSEAVKRNAIVTIAPVTAGDWTSGWTLKDSATTPNTLLTQSASEGVSITTSLGTVVYQASGRPTTASVGTFEVVASTGVKCVKVDSSGIPSTKSAACS